MKTFANKNNLFMSVSQTDLENIEFPYNDHMNVSPKLNPSSSKLQLKKLNRGGKNAHG